MISPELARILECRRDELNRLYHQRAGRHPESRADDFLQLFGSLAEAAVSPILKDSKLRESAGTVVRGIFLAALDLWSRGSLGEEGGGLEKGLASMLSTFPGPVAQDPERFVRSAAAAMETTSAKSDETLSAWLGLMARCGAAVFGMDDFLKAGLAAAWLAGMPQYRPAALRALTGLSRQAASLLLGLDKSGSVADPAKDIESLSADPWHDPAAQAINAEPPQVYLTSAGGWRGYGGQFKAPPTLKLGEGGVLAVDGQAAFRLFADRWGTFLLNEPDADPKAVGKPPAAELALQKDGFRTCGKCFAAEKIVNLSKTGFPWGREDIPTTASVQFGNTIYFTHPLSYRVYIVGLPGQVHGKDDGNR